MGCESLDDTTQLEVPNDDLGILARARNKPIALADVDIRDVVKVAMETRLQS